MNIQIILEKGARIHEKQRDTQKELELVQEEMNRLHKQKNDLEAKQKQHDAELTQLICECDQLPPGSQRKEVICILLQRDQLTIT